MSEIQVLEQKAVQAYHDLLALIDRAFHANSKDRNAVLAIKNAAVQPMHDAGLTDAQKTTFQTVLDKAVAVPPPDPNAVAAVQAIAPTFRPVVAEVAPAGEISNDAPVAPVIPPNVLQQDALDQQKEEADTSPQSAIEASKAAKAARDSKSEEPADAEGTPGEESTESKAGTTEAETKD